jgi:hypothetical protein
VATAPCEECGCAYDYSIDDPGIVWEAGSAIDANCLNELCDCHLLPVHGTPVRLNLRS